MANADAAFGFRPINSMGGPYNGQTLKCRILSTASEGPLFVGDPVTLVGGADTQGYPTVKEADTVTEAVYGIVDSVDAVTAESLPYRAALTDRTINVVTAYGNYFVVQADGVMEAADVGQMTNFVAGAGSTAMGRSTYEISAADTGTSVTGEIRIISFLDQADNDLTLTNAKVIVTFQETPIAQTGQAGV